MIEELPLSNTMPITGYVEGQLSNDHDVQPVLAQIGG
jgi:hypothetical protein